MALVLLSGGLDSAALIQYALTHYDGVDALFIDYGQPARMAEEVAASTVWWRLGSARPDVALRYQRIRIGSAVAGVGEVPDAGQVGRVSTANMPARNLVFVGCAASYAGARWGDAAKVAAGTMDVEATILLGATADDQAHFPDCRGTFENAASAAARQALDGILPVNVGFPWRTMTKAQLLKLWAEKWPDTFGVVESTVSCYAGTGCQRCDACLVRARAMREIVCASEATP